MKYILGAMTVIIALSVSVAASAQDTRFEFAVRGLPFFAGYPGGGPGLGLKINLYITNNFSLGPIISGGGSTGVYGMNFEKTTSRLKRFRAYGNIKIVQARGGDVEINDMTGLVYYDTRFSEIAFGVGGGMRYELGRVISWDIVELNAYLGKISLVSMESGFIIKMFRKN